MRNAGVQKIVLIGPVPIWAPSLSKAVSDAYQNNWPHYLPARMNNMATETVRQTDKIMRDIAAKNAVSYFSPFDALCNGEGCLMFAEGKPFTWDSAHLTDAGARFVVRRMLDEIHFLDRK